MSKGPNNQPLVVSAKVAALAEAQGIKPPDFDRVMSGEPILPEDETADMMIDEIYRSRKEEPSGPHLDR
jgi:hypothetical protein